MIEVLIAVVIFSVGLLGLAGLQATGIQMNHSSLMRSQATILAYDIVDCLRANKTAAIAEDYNVAKGSTSSAGGLAEDDVNNWLTRIADVLPQGVGSIDVDNNARATVVVQWEDSRGQGQTVNFTIVSDI